MHCSLKYLAGSQAYFGVKTPSLASAAMSLPSASSPQRASRSPKRSFDEPNRFSTPRSTWAPVRRSRPTRALASPTQTWPPKILRTCSARPTLQCTRPSGMARTNGRSTNSRCTTACSEEFESRRTFESRSGMTNSTCTTNPSSISTPAKCSVLRRCLAGSTPNSGPKRRRSSSQSPNKRDRS